MILGRVSGLDAHVVVCTCGGVHTCGVAISLTVDPSPAAWAWNCNPTRPWPLQVCTMEPLHVNSFQDTSDPIHSGHSSLNIRTPLIFARPEVFSSP